MDKKNMFKDFFSNLKTYLSYIMKLGFGELFIQFITLVIIVLIACFIYIPVGLVQDLVLTFLSTFGIVLGDFAYAFLNLVFKIIAALIAVWVFVYLFNKRYENIKQELDSKEKELTIEKEKSAESVSIKDESIPISTENKANEEVDLPKTNND